MSVNTNPQTLIQQFLRQAVSDTAEEPQFAHMMQTLPTLFPSLSGAACVIFEPLNQVAASGSLTDQLDTLKATSASLSPGIHINPSVANAQSAGINHQYTLAATFPTDAPAPLGVLWLDDTESPDALAADDVFASVLDVLALLAKNAAAQSAQQQAEHQVEALIESTVDPVIIVNPNQRISHVNPAAETLFQVQADTIRNQPLSTLIQSDELLALIETHNRHQGEWSTHNGQTYLPRVSVVHNHDNSFAGLVITLQNITRYKKLSRNQSEFTRIVSHDLRSPLTAMQGFADMLDLQLVGELNERQAHFVDKILSGITQMTALVENIQDAGRYDPETGFYELSRSHCDLTEIIKKVVDNHLVPAEKQDLHVDWEVADNVPIIHADKHMLDRAITNLVDNAIKYTPNGSIINVHVTADDAEVRISVRDSGLGISPENQQRMFERHHRIAREEHKKVKGSGLGLFIVRSVAQRHGGRAWVESTEGQGSTFYLSIPLSGANVVGAQDTE